MALSPATRARFAREDSAYAAANATRSVDPRLHDALAQLAPDTPIRFASDAMVHEGTFSSVATDSFEVRTAEKVERYHLRTVDELWLRKPASRVAAEWAGIGALGGGFFVLNGGLCKGDTYNCGNKRQTSVAAMGVVVGTAAGAALGGIMASRSPHWARRYARWEKTRR